jgi:Tsi6
MTEQPEPIATVRAALSLARTRHAEIPSFSIYASCVAQLEFLLATLMKEVPVDRARLRTIMVGHYGVREFEEADPEFSRALVDAQWIASQMGEGLKLN